MPALLYCLGSPKEEQVDASARLVPFFLEGGETDHYSLVLII